MRNHLARILLICDLGTRLNTLQTQMWKRQFTPSHPQIFQRVLTFRYINLRAFRSSFVTKSMPLLLLLGFFSKSGMSQYPWIISWSCFESCWYPCTGPGGFLTQPGWAGRCWRQEDSFFLFLSLFFFPSLVTAGFGWSSINSTTSTGSSAGVNFTHLLQKQTLPFTVGIFLLSWAHTICKCWSWSVRLCNFEKDTQIFNALLVAEQ